MRILLSNDDGVEARGLAVLARAMRELGEVTIVAPDRDRSGASNSLTLSTPLRIKRLEERCFRVAGTPSDCVHLALTGLLDEDPDVVVSGINHGANMGDDVIYSGTVAAAMEGRSLGHASIAVSLCLTDQPPQFETAARAVAELLTHARHRQLPADTILNVNVPNLPWSEITGFEATRLGNRHRAEPMIRQEDPRGRPVYWIGPPGSEEDAGPGTDFNAVRRGAVSVTPIHADLTRYRALDTLADWMGQMQTDGSGDGG